MTVITWQVSAGVLTELAPDLRVGNPAGLNTYTTVVYEAPQNPHRSSAVIARVRAAKHVNDLMRLEDLVRAGVKAPSNAY
jgi:hypothetical protein